MVFQRYATLTKTSQKRLNPQVMRRQIDYITNRMLGAGRAKTWGIDPSYPKAPSMTDDGEWTYSATLAIKRTGRENARDVMDIQASTMIQLGETAGNASGWSVSSAERASEKAEQEAQTDEVQAYHVPVTFQRPRLSEGSLNRNGHFDHIYERSSQISLIESSLNAFITSELRNRFHCVLWGEPASGKTEILRSFSKMLGPELILELDATSTTKAGAERILLEAEHVPPVMICEEIEKTDEASLRWLLGVLDHRGEIRKTTNRGQRQRNVKMLCLATINDMPLFKRVMDGALASRFSQKIYCPRPSKQVLRLILSREVEKIDGNPAWIEPAIDYCVDIEDTNDPRRVVTVCLSGQDRLLTGEYQEWLAETIGPPKK